jgi:hypothetical protein
MIQNTTSDGPISLGPSKVQFAWLEGLKDLGTSSAMHVTTAESPMVQGPFALQNAFFPLYFVYL